jgi:hypothetical protein
MTTAAASSVTPADAANFRLLAPSPVSASGTPRANTRNPVTSTTSAPALFGQLPDDELPNLQTPEDVSNFLARVVVLLAEGRITARRATVLTYAGSLLLRSAVVIKANEKTEIIWDLDRPKVGDDPESRRVEEPSPGPDGSQPMTDPISRRLSAFCTSFSLRPSAAGYRLLACQLHLRPRRRQRVSPPAGTTRANTFRGGF